MERLHALCRRIDGRSYRAYKDLAGRYTFDGMTLHVDHVQGDPFAAPSRIRVVIPTPAAGFPAHAMESPVRRTALADYLARAAAEAIRGEAAPGGSGGRGSGGSGRIQICPCGQEILPRSNVEVFDDHIALRLTAGLPAAGRRILGRQAFELLSSRVPAIVRGSMLASAHDDDALRHHLDTAEDSRALRGLLVERGWVAFVADGALLPRRAGNDDRPMVDDAVPWHSPDSLAAEVQLPHGGPIRGTGIPAGVTLITGGGYHGKSTLLQALLRGIYDHVPGDGRERVVSVGDTCAIRAEDGRRIEGVDLRPFIGALPSPAGHPPRDTSSFCTEDASGSTSQAAAILEALELGASVLLVDEDTSATNFMVRDQRMQALIPEAQEPITPFIGRVRELHERHRVSSVLVIGGVGDYLDVADTVLMMDAYIPRDATGRARDVVAEQPLEGTNPPPSQHLPPSPRGISRRTLDPRRGRRDRVRARGVRTIQFGGEEIDITFVEQIVDPAQARYLGDCLLEIARGRPGEDESVAALCRSLDARARADGVSALGDFRGGAGDRALARPLEIAAALNRLRGLQTIR